MCEWTCTSVMNLSIYLPIHILACTLTTCQEIRTLILSSSLLLTISHELQVYAIPDLIWKALPSRNWRDFICPFYVNKQLRVHFGIIHGCWVGFYFEHLFWFFWQPSCRHCHSSPLHFHSNCISVFDTKRSYRDITYQHRLWLILQCKIGLPSSESGPFFWQLQLFNSGKDSQIHRFTVKSLSFTFSFYTVLYSEHDSDNTDMHNSRKVLVRNWIWNTAKSVSWLFYIFFAGFLFMT